MSSVVKIYALFLGSALLLFAGGLQGLLLSVRGADEHFSLLALGLIGTGWSVGFIAGSVAVPLLVQRVGHIRAFSIMAAIGTITILCNLLLINDIAWIVMVPIAAMIENARICPTRCTSSGTVIDPAMKPTDQPVPISPSASSEKCSSAPRTLSSSPCSPPANSSKAEPRNSA